MQTNLDPPASSSVTPTPWIIFWCALGVWVVLVVTSWSQLPYWPDAEGYADHVAHGRWVAHPPGYPFFVLLGHLFALLGASPYLSVQLASFCLVVGGLGGLALLLRERCPAATLPVLLAAFLLSWMTLLIAKTGTSHSADLFTVPLFLWSALRFIQMQGRGSSPILLAGAILLVAGFRLNTLIMQGPAIALLLWWSWRNWKMWTALAGAGIAVVLLQLAVINASGGWQPYSEYAAAMNAENRLSSILLNGFTATTALNIMRSLVWFTLSIGPLLVLVLYFKPKLMRDPAFVLGAVSAGSTLAITTLYLCTHPGYLAPALPGFLLCVARVHSMNPSTPLFRRVLYAAPVFGALLFFFMTPIEPPKTKPHAILNGVLFQYGHSAAGSSLFHTTSEWLVLSGFSDAVPAERIEHLQKQGRLQGNDP